jgi:hypothetical protein
MERSAKLATSIPPNESFIPCLVKEIGGTPIRLRRWLRVKR